VSLNSGTVERILTTVRDGQFKLTDALEARIAELEREVRTLKDRAPTPEEWPLRVVNGGRGD
jgi:hypothetical protein